MTRGSAEQTTHTPWFAKAGAACSIVPLSRFVGPHIFALKGGGFGCLFSCTGVDEENLTDQELDAHVRGVEGALRGLPDGACLTQYSRVLLGAELPRMESYPQPATTRFVTDRVRSLVANAGLRRIDLFWCLTLQPQQTEPLQRKPSEEAVRTTRALAELRKSSTVLESHLGSTLGLQLLGKQECFKFFSYLFNLEEWAAKDQLRSDDGVDRQIVKSPVSWQQDHLRVGKRFVQMFSLQATPESSRPGQFLDIQTIDCDAVLSTTWRPRSSAAVRREIDRQEKFISFFSVGVFGRVMAGRDTASLETTAGSKAAGLRVEDLGAVLKDLDRKGQGEFSLRLLLAAKNQEQLQATLPAVHTAFLNAGAQVVEETVGNLSAFYAMFPGNGRFNVFPLWLSEEHHARLSGIFAPHLGHPHSEDLDGEYLNVFETRSRTPFFQDAYVNGVRVMLILGPTGTGKSVHGNLAVAHEQKYGGFTFLFDIGGSYESVVKLYGGKVDRVGKDGPRVNPFALEPTPVNLAFLHGFVKLLLNNSGAMLTPEDDDAVFKSVQGMYYLDASVRRLSSIFLPHHLQRYLGKWVGSGVYGAIFDNVEDTLSLARLQCFDFAGVNNKQHADLIEPLMVWLLRRIDDVLYDPANLGVPKHVLIEELFSSMKNKQLLEAALASIKTVRKNLGGVTLIGQSARDLGENADSIVNSCTSFLFLPDVTFNREHYQKLFSLTDQQLALFESLGEREGLYIRRDGLTKVLRLTLDPRSYGTFTTRPKDRRRRALLIERHGLEEGLDRFAAGETA